MSACSMNEIDIKYEPSPADCLGESSTLPVDKKSIAPLAAVVDNAATLMSQPEPFIEVNVKEELMEFVSNDDTLQLHPIEAVYCDTQNLKPEEPCPTLPPDDGDPLTDANEHATKSDHCYNIRLDADDLNNLRTVAEKTSLVNSLLMQNIELEEKNAMLAREKQELQDKLSQLKKKSKNLQAAIKIKKAQATVKPGFRLNKILLNNTKIQYYTGFESSVCLVKFLDSIVGAYRSNHPAAECQTEALDHRDQVFLVLCRLRLGLLEMDLALQFNISVSTVDEVWATWIPFMSGFLNSVPFWPSREVIQEHIPDSFKVTYPTTRVILDCTEILIDNPSALRVRSGTFSRYKTQTASKGFVGITPNGLVCFVSDLYDGKISVKEITERSGLYDLLESGDSVMADQGFLIQNRLKQLGVELNTAPFLTEKPPRSEAEAQIRIDVERVIQGIKHFRILNYVFPNTMSTTVNDIWKICCFLNNFVAEPVLDR